MIHDRIRRARVLKGYTLDALAQRIGDITKQALSKFESGQTAPNSTRLLQLAKALELSPEYFFRADAVELAPLEFRKLAKMPKYRQEQVTERIREHLERYIALENCFEHADIDTPVTQRQMIAVTSFDEAEGAAKQLREHWQIGEDAIANLTELLEERGIKVALLHGPDDFDGACAATQDGKHVLIALNAERPGERMRFTAAHELGHWVMKFPADMSEKDVEICCHRFAGAFLYPASCVTADFGGHQRSRVHPRELLIAKQHYGLSMAAALRRLKDLALLSDAGYQYCTIQFSKNGWRKEEPEALPSETPRRFESLVFWGLAEDFFSKSRAAEFLQQPLSALDPSLTGPLGIQ
jgi:Zn-dependent peptidase ImmA (M78 family)/transcriptional regulator with XRE-family HTH domain